MAETAARILVLSSTPEVVRRLRDTLEPVGYRLTIASAEADVAEEVTRATRLTGHKPDVVILAAGLAEPELREYVSRNMKRLGGSSNSARPGVIVLPSRASGGGIEKFDTGADMYLAERFVPEELLAFVRRLMWMRLIRRGEDAMLEGYHAEAEQYYLTALAYARSAAPEDPGWHKTLANLRYLYVNYLCEHPLSPDILRERTVPVWEPVLGPEHYFIARWVLFIEQWRRTLSENPSEAGQPHDAVPRFQET